MFKGRPAPAERPASAPRSYRPGGGGVYAASGSTSPGLGTGNRPVTVPRKRPAARLMMKLNAPLGAAPSGLPVSFRQNSSASSYGWRSKPTGGSSSDSVRGMARTTVVGGPPEPTAAP